MFDRDNPAIGLGHFICAHSETTGQRTGQRQEEAAGAAVRRGLLRHRRVRATQAGVPALGGVEPSESRQHPHPAEAQLQGDFLDLRIVGQHIGRHQSRVAQCGRQHIAGAEVTRLEPLAPRHPGRRQ
ncbi:MAG: hypothetical protein QOH56_2744 [Pseudonocardiales bacterium]|nr:hypothetical protein [Frankiales bacterium]MDQ1736493.1 hypothetical protein [Pseudonocardiales bacterium]